MKNVSFLKLILKNPFRSKSRALLAIIGIGIGIATIVALGAVTDGMIASADDILHAGGYDFTIEGKTDENTSSTSMMSFGTTTFNENYLDKISKIKGVKEVVGIYMATPRTEKSPMFVLIGMNSSAKNLAELTITEGRIYKNNANEIIMGKISSEKENKTIGDKIKLNGENYKVVGLFESGNVFQDQGAFTGLNKARDFFKHVIKGERTNMILTGTAGEGKTHVVVGLLKALCFTAKTGKINDFEVKGFYSVRYITSKDLCDSYARTQRFDSGYTTYSFYNDFVKSYDILAIDELGKATTKNEWEILFDILDKRLCALDSAADVAAELQQELALRSVVVHGIESSDAKSVSRSATTNVSSPADAFRRNPAEHALHKPKDFEESALANRVTAEEIRATFLDFGSVELSEDFLRTRLRLDLVDMSKSLGRIRKSLDRLYRAVKLQIIVRYKLNCTSNMISHRSSSPAIMLRPESTAMESAS